jgi:hypothetical protein
MPTEKTENQKSASRANGAKTHGPITPEGKRKSARNSFRHGLLAKAIVFEGESREQFAALLKAFSDELQPQTPIEDLLVQKMAVNHWRQERIWGQQKARALQQSAAQASGLQEYSPQENAPQEIHQAESRLATLMNVTEMRYDRQFGRALDRLLQYRITRENQSREASENPEKLETCVHGPGN